MVKIKKAVFDSGPIIHISEIEQAKCLKLIKKRLISQQVEEEILTKEAPGRTELKFFEIENLKDKSKDLLNYLATKYYLDMGEASSIALCKQEKISFFFTDDLNARNVGKDYGLKVHGTLGIIMRSYRENMLTKKEAIKLLKELKSESSLFITSYLVDYAINEINKFSRKLN